MAEKQTRREANHFEFTGTGVDGIFDTTSVAGKPAISGTASFVESLR